jgi:S1-C subfamily serine protease
VGVLRDFGLSRDDGRGAYLLERKENRLRAVIDVLRREQMKKTLALLITASISAFGADYTPLVKSTMNKVVTIYVQGIGTPDLTIMDVLASNVPKERPMGFLGSGSIVSEDGVILTCDHLFTHKLKDREITVKLASGQKLKAIILAEDKRRDLATLKVFPLHKLQHFTFGKPLSKGQAVVSFGSPLGWEQTVSFGYVENLGISDTQSLRTVHGASINPGNSGGPLVDATGHLVGVNIESMVGMEALHLAVTLKDIHSFLWE